jgi:class 3 adenylate cyclase/CheY-like chemotaxis protein
MTGLPNGTVTLLFTDIEGSTPLAVALGGGWEPVLEAHRNVIREAVVDAGGHEVDCRADEVFAAFAAADAAVAATIAAQRALAREPWPDAAPLRVRMGLHTGRPTLSRSTYIGVDVHQAHRVASAAHGGQILLSAATSAVLASPPELLDLGVHPLAGIPEPQRLFQVLAPGLQRTFPRPRVRRAAAGERGPCVVLADDSVLLREGIVRLLEDEGFLVAAQSGTADELLRDVELHAPDVAIVDLRMPPTHTDEGLQAAKEIRRRHPRVGVLVLSQYVEPAYARELVEGTRERVGYLLKDRVADVDEFAAAVRTIAAGGCAFDPLLPSFGG